MCPRPPVRRVALLRGINVGKGARIAMADLVACTAEAGCADVRTVLATGNVVFSDARPPVELRRVLEDAYAERFGYAAVVQVFDRDTVVAAIEAYPFESLEEHHDYVVFSDAPAVTERVAGTMHAAIEAPGTEAVAAGPGLLYWRCRRGSTLSSPAGKVLDSRENKAHLTTRNLRTLRRILAAG